LPQFFGSVEFAEGGKSSAGYTLRSEPAHNCIHFSPDITLSL